jgi:hypothetical protein
MIQTTPTKGRTTAATSLLRGKLGASPSPYLLQIKTKLKSRARAHTKNTIEMMSSVDDPCQYASERSPPAAAPNNIAKTAKLATGKAALVSDKCKTPDALKLKRGLIDSPDT